MHVELFTDRLSYVDFNGRRYGPYFTPREVAEQVQDIADGRTATVRELVMTLRATSTRRGLKIERLPDGSIAVSKDMYEVCRIRVEGGDIVFEGSVTGILGCYPMTPTGIKMVLKLLDFELSHM